MACEESLAFCRLPLSVFEICRLIFVFASLAFRHYLSFDMSALLLLIQVTGLSGLSYAALAARCSYVTYPNLLARGLYH